MKIAKDNEHRKNAVEMQHQLDTMTAQCDALNEILIEKDKEIKNIKSAAKPKPKPKRRASSQPPPQKTEPTRHAIHTPPVKKVNLKKKEKRKSRASRMRNGKLKVKNLNMMKKVCIGQRNTQDGNTIPILSNGTKYRNKVRC